MGQMTVTEIVSAGLTLSGDTGAVVPARAYFKTWLRRLLNQYRWKFLTNYKEIVLPVGAGYVLLGADADGQRVRQIHDARIADPALNNGFKRDLEVIQLDDARAHDYPGWGDTAGLGVPNRLIIEPAGVDGQWKVYSSPLSNVAYRISLTVQFEQADPADGAKPVYPEDETMIRAAYAYGMGYQQDEREIAADAKLLQMIRQDLVVHGRKAGRNFLGLSRHRFPSRRR